ncbi:MAG TPA: TRAP transporter substrate-binding protein DctP [Stellaceae bacterium]|jgi:TRAP-type C4-dicarboxylate transport system substrate-binding protein|nr:TRAP transporter substrate-binding protein DctP [Stellaceae bacterium]
MLARGGRTRRRGILPVVAIAAALTISSAIVRADEASPALLRYGYPNPPITDQYHDLIEGWTSKVNSDANGLFRIQVFAGGTLIDMRSTLDRVADGVADIAFCVLGPVSSLFPQSLVATLPGVASDSRNASLAMQRLYESGVIGDEWKKVRPLGFGIYPGLSFHTVRPVKTLADMKGLKISIQDRLAGQTLEALGGVPISLPLDQVYEALQHGTIQGVTLGWPGVVTGYKLTDVVKYHVLDSFGAIEAVIIMNNATYARLSPEAKRVIDADSGTFLTDWFGRVVNRTTQNSIAQIRQMKGQTIESLSDDQRALWTKQIEPVIAAWEKSTPNGAQVLAAYRKELAASHAEP